MRPRHPQQDIFRLSSLEDVEAEHGRRVSALVGLMAGIRSSSALALVEEVRAAQFPLSKHHQNVWRALVAGEVVADKLPFVPARVTTGPLLARIASAASSAMRLSTDRERKMADAA